LVELAVDCSEQQALEQQLPELPVVPVLPPLEVACPELVPLLLVVPVPLEVLSCTTFEDEQPQLLRASTETEMSLRRVMKSSKEAVNCRRIAAFLSNG
jgi:hypothetical protein